MSVQWIEHNGYEILFFDHRNLTPKEIIDNLKAGKEMVADITGGLRVLSDFKGATVDVSVMQYLKTSGAETIEPIAHKTAVVGITGIRHILIQTYNRFTGAGQHQQIFDTEDAALVWLTTD